MARREIWRLSPETDRAVGEAARAAIREIWETRRRAHDDIRRACEAWAHETYGPSPAITRSFVSFRRGREIDMELHVVAIPDRA